MIAHGNLNEFISVFLNGLKVEYHTMPLTLSLLVAYFVNMK